jgi:hypothetical protein
VVGELSAGQGSQPAAEDIHKVFQQSGRKTGLLPKLPE